MTMLADEVDVVIGVDTHKHTHTAAVVKAGTGAAMAEATVATNPDGYLTLMELADAQGKRRAWAIEGTGGYGAGLTRFLLEAGEQVVELDRPERTRRRGGAKSDPLDAVRAAREALSRTQLAQPRARGQRAALSVPLVARRSAVEASGDAPRQLDVVVTAPEILRSRFRGRSTIKMNSTATRLRIDGNWDHETKVTAGVLRALAAPTSWLSWVSAPSWPPPCSVPGRIRAPAATTARSPSSAGPARFPRRRG
jgi:hypothetical protein